MPASREEKNHARRVVRHLAKHYADAECALHYDSPFQLLIATILSAQCTDERVNMVTAVLFAKYPTAFELAKATQKQVEKIVKSAGFFRAKAKNIRACAKDLVEKYEGQPPQDLEKLVALAGVGRKTGNVLLGTAFGIPSGVVVDTHVGRISRRLGITFEKDPVKVERELMAVLPKKEWIYYSHRMIHHGRAICDARKPLCEQCSMRNFCPRIGVK
ncbi:MAG: endonuclease III [Planctomycetaceae bacterium]